MRFRTIGVEEDQIPIIGQGCMGIGTYVEMDNTLDDSYISILKHCIDCGITFFDTAEAYGNGYSEYLIGKATEGKRGEVFIATKVSAENLIPEDIINSVNNSLDRLATDFIDLYQLHWYNNEVPIVDTMGVMSQLKREGKIKHIGVSNFSLDEFVEAQNVCDDRIDAIQLEYNLYERIIEHDMLEYCEKNNILVIAYSPLNNGEICNKAKKLHILEKLALQYGMTFAQIILNWVISHPSVVAVSSSKNLQHITENSKAADYLVTEKDLCKIGRIFRQEKIYVYPEKIKVEEGGRGNKKVYSTIEEARENSFGFVPSPTSLAKKFKKDKKAKPIKVIAIEDDTGMYDYKLIEGRLRYWAWAIAFDWKEPILVSVLES